MLDWSARVKIMQALLQGEFGHEIRYAMGPYFAFDVSGDELPADVVRAHSRVNNQRQWGWECIQTGTDDYHLLLL